MSCFAEATYSVYVDGELPPDQVHPLELHLMQSFAQRFGIKRFVTDEGLAGDPGQEIIDRLDVMALARQ